MPSSASLLIPLLLPLLCVARSTHGKKAGIQRPTSHHDRAVHHLFHEVIVTALHGESQLANRSSAARRLYVDDPDYFLQLVPFACPIEITAMDQCTRDEHIYDDDYGYYNYYSGGAYGYYEYTDDRGSFSDDYYYDDGFYFYDDYYYDDDFYDDDDLYGYYGVYGDDHRGSNPFSGLSCTSLQSLWEEEEKPCATLLTDTVEYFYDDDSKLNRYLLCEGEIFDLMNCALSVVCPYQMLQCERLSGSSHKKGGSSSSSDGNAALISVIVIICVAATAGLGFMLWRNRARVVATKASLFSVVQRRSRGGHSSLSTIEAKDDSSSANPMASALL